MSHTAIRITLLSVVVLGSLSLTDLLSAQSDQPSIGDRVRVIRAANPATTQGWQTGTLIEVDASSLTILRDGGEGPIQVGFDDLSRLQVSLGQSSETGVRFLAVGAAIGFVLGAGLNLFSQEGGSDDWISAAIAGGAIGGTAGGIIGFTKENWRDAEVEAHGMGAALGKSRFKVNGNPRTSSLWIAVEVY